MSSPFGVNTYSYIWRFGVRDTLAHLADQGFSRFEVLVNPPHLWPAAMGRAERDAVGALLAERDLRILSLNPPSLDLNLTSPAEEMRRYTLEHYKDVIRLAGEWGVPYIIVMPGKTHPLLPAPRERVLDWCRSALAAMLAEAEPFGIELLLENIPAAFLPRAPELAAFVADFGHPRLGIIYDVANGVFAREAPDEGILAVRPHLRMVHLSDTGTDKWDHGPVGSGVVPFADAAAALAEIGYQGPTVLEIISPDPERDIPESAEKLHALGWAR